MEGHIENKILSEYVTFQNKRIYLIYNLPKCQS